MDAPLDLPLLVAMQRTTDAPGSDRHIGASLSQDGRVMIWEAAERLRINLGGSRDQWSKLSLDGIYVRPCPHFTEGLVIYERKTGLPIWLVSIVLRPTGLEFTINRSGPEAERLWWIMQHVPPGGFELSVGNGTVDRSLDPVRIDEAVFGPLQIRPK